MVYKKESLEKMLLLLSDICSEPEHLWFRDKLMEQLGDSKNRSTKNAGNFGSYFKLLKKQFKIKANKFYENIKDPNLKKQLVSDCVKMYWYQVNNDVNQLFVHAFFQLENLVNYYMFHSNCFNKVNGDKNYYTHVFNEKFKVVCSNQFFTDDAPRAISKINIWSKIVYWAYDTDKKDFLEKNHTNISSLIGIRNQNNHRSSTGDHITTSSVDYNKATIEKLISADYSAFGFYMNILKDISNSLNEIKTGVSKRDFVHTKVTLQPLKVLDVVDVSKYKR